MVRVGHWHAILVCLVSMETENKPPKYMSYLAHMQYEFSFFKQSTLISDGNKV